MIKVQHFVTNQVTPFKEYLDFMFEEKTSNPVGCWNEANKVLPYDLLRAAVFYPTRCDIRQSQDYSLDLCVKVATIMQAEFRNETKNT